MNRRLRYPTSIALCLAAWLAASPGRAAYVNFESSHVHPIALTPSGTRLLAVNTPDAMLEVFDVAPDGALTHAASIPVGLEPVSVVPRSDTEAWVVNQLSDSVSVVDLVAGAATRTLATGDEPTDVTFASGKAFVTVAQEDEILVFDTANLDAARNAQTVPTSGRTAPSQASESGFCREGRRGATNVLVSPQQAGEWGTARAAGRRRGRRRWSPPSHPSSRRVAD